ERKKQKARAHIGPLPPTGRGSTSPTRCARQAWLGPNGPTFARAFRHLAHIERLFTVPLCLFPLTFVRGDTEASRCWANSLRAMRKRKGNYVIRHLGYWWRS